MAYCYNTLLLIYKLNYIYILYHSFILSYILLIITTLFMYSFQNIIYSIPHISALTNLQRPHFLIHIPLKNSDQMVLYPRLE